MHGMWVYTPSCSAILASCMPPKQGKYLNYRSSDYLWSIPRHFKEPWFGIWRGNRETLLLQGFENRAAHPHPNFWEVPPSPPGQNIFEFIFMINWSTFCTYVTRLSSFASCRNGATFGATLVNTLNKIYCGSTAAGVCVRK